MIHYRHPLESERLPILDLVAASFQHAHASRPEVRQAVLDDPEYAPCQAIVAVDGDELLGHTVIKRTAVSLGGNPPLWLPVGRIGTVCTAPAARRRGIGRGLIEGACELLGGVGATILNPAPEDYVRVFYERQGFMAAIRTRPLHEVRHAAVPPAPSGVVVRPAAVADVPVLNSLYLDHYGPQAGSLTRTTQWWAQRVETRPMLWSTMPPAVTVAERSGRVVGYAVTADDDQMRLWEWACEPDEDEAARALLAAAVADTGEHVGLAIAPHDRLFRLLAELDPRDVSPLPGPVMLRAAELDILRPVLAAYVLAHGGELHGDAWQAEVRCGRARLTCSWSALLALAYDGRVLCRWIDEGVAKAQPDDRRTRAVLNEVLPQRVAGRRLTDAY